jgi:hypothetical protein
MPLNNTAKNSALTHLGTLISHVSLHSADPGAGGASELGAPVVRQSVTWNAAASANLDSSNTQVFSVGAGQVVAYVGLWSASTSGTFYGSRALAAPETFSNAGTFTVNDLDINLTDA